MSGNKDLGDISMLELFKIETEEQAKILSEVLLELENNPTSADCLEQLMRASHSIKGAARMVGVDVAVRVAHIMEDCFVAAQEGLIIINNDNIDTLLKGVDILVDISELSPDSSADWFGKNATNVESVINDVADIINQTSSPKNSVSKQKSVIETTDKISGIETEEVNYSDIITADDMMIDLFKYDAAIHISAIMAGIKINNLDSTKPLPESEEIMENLKQSACLLKGGAELVELYSIVKLARAIEDYFTSVREGMAKLTQQNVDSLVQCIDIIKEVINGLESGNPTWESDNTNRERLDNAINLLPSSIGRDSNEPASNTEPFSPVVEKSKINTPVPEKKTATGSNKIEQRARKKKSDSTDTIVRVSSNSLNRLMGLAGESIVESRKLRPYADSLLTLKRRQTEMFTKLDKLSEHAQDENSSELLLQMMSEIRKNATECRNTFSERLEELETFDRSLNNLSGRLNREVISSRMRPFSDGTHGFQRMVRDVGRSLNKRVKLEISGLNTMVDRDIMEKIEAPLNHLLRNSVDHGIESPEECEKAGKPAEGTIKLTAMHNSGMLSILIEDDGKGVDLDSLKNKIITKGMASEQMVRKMSESELLDFMFLPGFSTRDNVTEVSGRGVGLDVVHSVVQEMHGVIRTTSTPGQGIRFKLQLPLTLSVIRALLVNICNEPYAFPLARIDCTLKLHKDNIKTLEGRQYFMLDNEHVGIVSAKQVMELEGEEQEQDDELSIVIIGEKLNRYAMVVDKFLGERSMVVQKIDPALGKIHGIGTAAILDDGAPVLIVDADDMVRSIELYISGGHVVNINSQIKDDDFKNKKRILVVDDSITVREVERNMLESRGYSVEIAVDGVDGWNAVRTGEYDLVISDIDMPRMNGFEFVENIKSDKVLNKIPVMIVSYKDREEDRLHGLEAGADYYLTKGSFQDETLLEAVEDLIGKAT